MLRGTMEGLTDAAFHMLPTASGVLLPNALAQSDDLMHFPHVEGVGAQQTEEFQAAEQLIDVVRRLRVLWVGIGIRLHRHKAVEVVSQAGLDAQDLAALLGVATAESRKGGGFEGVGSGHRSMVLLMPHKRKACWSWWTYNKLHLWIRSRPPAKPRSQSNRVLTPYIVSL